MAGRKTTRQDAPLYERLGGEAAIRATVSEFYQRVLADPLLAPFFKAKQMKNLEEHQVAFFTTALGGPAIYTGRSMKDAHARLKLSGKHFDAVAGHLVATLQHLGIEAALINEVVAAVGPLKDDIVNKRESGAEAMKTTLRGVDRITSVTDSLEGLAGTLESLQGPCK